MTEELQNAEMLCSYRFYHRPELPTTGILRLDTENEQLHVVVTRQILQKLSKICLKHADQLEEMQWLLQSTYHVWQVYVHRDAMNSVSIFCLDHCYTDYVVFLIAVTVADLISESIRAYSPKLLPSDK